MTTPNCAETIYISGPMSGLPEHNFPAFHEAAANLRACGAVVVSPAEFDSDVSQPWEYYLRRDIRALMDCTAIYLLPGWENSRGATLELYIATQLKMRVIVA